LSKTITFFRSLWADNSVCYHLFSFLSRGDWKIFFNTS